MRSSAVIGASAGKATTISRATCASRRFSANSAVFHRTAELAELLGRTLGQQHLMVLGGVAMAEVEHLAGALGLDRVARIVGGRAHRVAAGRAREVAGAGKLDRHAGDHDQGAGAAKPACRGIYAAAPEGHSPECILRLQTRSPQARSVAEPALRWVRNPQPCRLFAPRLRLLPAASLRAINTRGGQSCCRDHHDPHAPGFCERTIFCRHREPKTSAVSLPGESAAESPPVARRVWR